MSKLYCYGITPRALQLLLKERFDPRLPVGWFNWLITNYDGYATQRLTIVDPKNSAKPVLNWNRNAQAAGYASVLVYATDDPRNNTDHAEDRVGTLSNDVVLHPISHMPTLAEREEQIEVLTLLREPEDFFINAWDFVQRGGCGFIDEQNFSDVQPKHWWAYGVGLKKWIEQTADGQPDSVHRNICPDYASWNFMKSLGFEYPDIKLDLQWFWNSPQSNPWHWSLENPCTTTDIPAMKPEGFVAFYPMTPIPCCGVAVKESGELVPIGALPDEKDANGWVWADEKTNAAFQAISKEVASRMREIQPVKYSIKAFLTTSVLMARLQKSSAAISKSSLGYAFVALLAVTLFFPARHMYEDEGNVERGGVDSQVVYAKDLPGSVNALKTEMDSLDIAYSMATKEGSTIIVVNSIDPGKKEVMAFLMRNKLAIPSHRKMVIEIRPQ